MSVCWTAILLLLVISCTKISTSSIARLAYYLFPFSFCLCWFFAFVCLLDAIYGVQSPSTTKVINALNRSVLGKITVSYTRLADIYKCIGGRPRTDGLEDWECVWVWWVCHFSRRPLVSREMANINNTNEISMFFDQFFSLFFWFFLFVYSFSHL